METNSKRDKGSDARLKDATQTLRKLSSKYSIDLPADYYVAVARTFLVKRDLEEARRNLRRAVQIDGANAKAWWELVSSYLDEHRYSIALEKATEALRK